MCLLIVVDILDLCIVLVDIDSNVSFLFGGYVSGDIFGGYNDFDLGGNGIVGGGIFGAIEKTLQP